MRIECTIPGRLELAANQLQLRLPITFVLPEEKSPELESVVVCAASFDGMSLAAVDEKVEFYRPGKALDADAKPIEEPVRLRPEGSGRTNRLDACFSLPLPDEEAPPGVVDVVIKMKMEFPGALHVAFVFTLRLDFKTGRVAVDQIQREYEPTLIRANFFLLLGILTGLSVWNELFNQGVHGESWLTPEAVDKVLFFTYGFFGLQAAIVLLRNIASVQALWKLPEAYLPMETSQFLDSRGTLAALCACGLILFALVGWNLSVSAPDQLANQIWLDGAGQPVVSERVKLWDLFGLQSVCQDAIERNIGNPISLAGIPEVEDWWHAGRKRTWPPQHSCREFQLLVANDLADRFSPGCVVKQASSGSAPGIMSFNGCEWMENGCLWPVRTELSRHICGVDGDDRGTADLLVESHGESGSWWVKDPQLIYPYELSSYMKDLVDDLAAETPDDLVANPQLRPANLVSRVNLPQGTRITREALLTRYRTLVQRNLQERPETATRALVEMSTLIRVYRKTRSESLIADDFMTFATDFRTFYAQPRGTPRADHQPNTPKAEGGNYAPDKIGDRPLFRAYIRFLLVVEDAYFGSPDVYVIREAIQHVANKAGDDIYIHVAQELAELDLLHRERDGIDVLEGRRKFLQLSLQNVLMGSFVQDRLKALVTALSKASRTKDAQFFNHILQPMVVDSVP